VVTAVRPQLQPQGMGRVAQNRIEIDDSVELAARPDPMVDRLSVLLGSRRIVGFESFEGSKGCSVNSDPVRVGPDDELLVGRDDIARYGGRFAAGSGCRCCTQIIDSLQQDYPSHPGLRRQFPD